MDYKYFINDLIIILSALFGLCLSSGVIFKANIYPTYYYELNTSFAYFIYFTGFLTGIIYIWRILNSKNFKAPKILYINTNINSYLYANGFLVYSFTINMLFNALPLALIPDMCNYFYGSYYKAKDFYYIMFFLYFFAGFTQSASVSYIILEKYKIVANKLFVIPLLLFCIISFLIGIFFIK